MASKTTPHLARYARHPLPRGEGVALRRFHQPERDG